MTADCRRHQSFSQGPGKASHQSRHLRLREGAAQDGAGDRLHGLGVQGHRRPLELLERDIHAEPGGNKNGEFEGEQFTMIYVDGNNPLEK